MQSIEIRATKSSGFPAVSRQDARILVLGSLPGQRSMCASEYYAHPQNVFWRIMRELTGADGSYDQRCEALGAHGIALWDVLANSVRPGSMDSSIQTDTAEANDFDGFFLSHPGIERVCFNGKMAAKLFQQLVLIDAAKSPMHFETLPSTSPAYASMAFRDKLEKWRNAIS